MSMRCFLFVIGLVSLTLFGVRVHAASDVLHIELGVYHCDNDAICEVAENAEFCPLDCVAPPATTTEEEPEDEPSLPSQRPRIIDQIVDLFQTYIPFVGTPQDVSGPSNEGFVCTDGSCTAFTEDLARSVIVSFEESSGNSEGSSVLISPISGNEIVFEWEEGMMMRIMRSPQEFPIDPLNGELVYEGSSGSFKSFGVSDLDIMYYSLFPKREDGSYGDPEFVIVKSQNVPDDTKPTSKFVTVVVNTFVVAILGFIGRFIFLLI